MIAEGVPLIDGGTFRLPHLIGLSRAQDLIITGRPVTGKNRFKSTFVSHIVADECLQIGLANRVVPKGTSVHQALMLAREISNFPQRTMNTDRISARSNLIYEFRCFDSLGELSTTKMNRKP